MRTSGEAPTAKRNRPNPSEPWQELRLGPLRRTSHEALHIYKGVYTIGVCLVKETSNAHSPEERISISKTFLEQIRGKWASTARGTLSVLEMGGWGISRSAHR